MSKTAVASTDGKVVNQHFGRADCFYILEVDEDTGAFEVSEIRKAEPVCHSGDHTDEQMKEAVKRLSDCQYVLVSKVGMRARNELEAFGIGVYELPGVIEESVDQLVRYQKVQQLLENAIS